MFYMILIANKFSGLYKIMKEVKVFTTLVASASN